MALRKPANQMQPTIVTPKKAMESLMTMVSSYLLLLCVNYCDSVGW